MKNRKSPHIKKQNEYDKDRRSSMEYPHSFRKSYPKKKARANQRERRVVQQIASAVGDADISPAMIKAVKRKLPKVKKGAHPTLRRTVDLKLQRRAELRAKPRKKR